MHDKYLHCIGITDIITIINSLKISIQTSSCVISFILCKYMLRVEVEKTLLIKLYVGFPKPPAEVEVLKYELRKHTLLSSLKLLTI